MKRSLYNQVNSQFSYPMILSSIISTNGWAWRIYIGPLNRFVADVVVYISNSAIVWSTLCLTEALVIRATFLMKFKYASSINDNFFSKFIFLFNIGFSDIKLLNFPKNKNSEVFFEDFKRRFMSKIGILGYIQLEERFEITPYSRVPNCGIFGNRSRL